ncbi:hypothetical protein B0H14DRAFT_2641769 [Mycena olivaceomarginata]|nr:hypothetical protein B0H14DRAFT_2641769 [Mycena olivaceomarginata]
MSLQMRYLLPFAKNRHQFGVGVNTWIRQTITQQMQMWMRRTIHDEVDSSRAAKDSFEAKETAVPARMVAKGVSVMGPSAVLSAVLARAGSSISIITTSSGSTSVSATAPPPRTVNANSEREEELVVARADALADPGAVVVEFEDTLGAGRTRRKSRIRRHPGEEQRKSVQSPSILVKRALRVCVEFVYSRSFIAGRFLESDGTAEDGALYRGLVSILWTPETIGVPCLRLAAAARATVST